MWFWTEFQFSQFWTENQICSFFAWKGSVLHTKCDFEVTSIFLIFSWNSHFAIRHHTGYLLPWISMWFCTEFQFSQFWPKTRICSFFASKRSWLHTECDFEVTSIFWNFFEIEFRHPSHTQGYCLGWSLWFGPDVHFLNSDPKIGFVRFSRENGRDCILNVILRSPQFF